MGKCLCSTPMDRPQSKRHPRRSPASRGTAGIVFRSAKRCSLGVIKSFADKRTEDAFGGTFDTGFPQEIHKRERRKLEMLNAATVLDDLRNPPGNRLHALTGDFAGF